ncbi:MAG: GPI inositol-deacylase [Pseudomonadota bacterium]|nr:GPI inositol-deacylase [Pseudomonadota bacterium]
MTEAVGNETNRSVTFCAAIANSVRPPVVKPASPPPATPPATTRDDLRGAARLVTDATQGLTDLVEAMHERIARLPGFDPPLPGARTGGITGLVYRSIRGVTRVAGGSVDALLALLRPVLDGTADSNTDTVTSVAKPEREALVATLNGVLGDYLAATANPLAIPMALRREGRTLRIDPGSIKAALPDVSGGLLVMVHGLCMNDLQWSRNGHDHGALLARELGLTPLYLHYNTGLHVSVNGRGLAHQLEALLAAWPQPVQRLVLLCHSMGGLVARSALLQAEAAGHGWTARLSDLVFLATPHHGAPLERAGHGLTTVLAATPYAAPLARLAKLRSAGITDLRHGYLRDEDWVGRDRFDRGPDRRTAAPLPEGVNSYALAACLGADEHDLKTRLLGDGLVPLDSALGRHADPAHTLDFAPAHQWVGHNLGHIELLERPEVTAQLMRWLRKG